VREGEENREDGGPGAMADREIGEKQRGGGEQGVERPMRHLVGVREGEKTRVGQGSEPIARNQEKTGYDRGHNGARQTS
jgi:hypothetical protein